ncbi:hexokinase-2-like [Portunus trituberculatus]|uniref:hexokinase-2-like n=1 Tax=Portunus trituberculatus TaxID=210409 RepID=UPI001E1D0B36|nr:hexokinase-2-like [Portunus trituberculatus]
MTFSQSSASSPPPASSASSPSRRPLPPYKATDLPHLTLTDAEKKKKIESLLSPLILTEAQQAKIREVFLEEMRLGLAVNPERPSSLLMENTFIPQLLDGTECGEYLALDLGGTNFRVLYVVLKDGKFVEETVDHYAVPTEVRLGEGEALFDFLAQCLSDFVQKKNLSGKNIKLGFTFSFPMTQKSLDVGILASWTKSFNCSGVVGKDAVQMLNKAIHKRDHLDIDVNAILNDTTGTLVMGSYLDHRCALGIIMGTGSNGAYIEKVDRIEKWQGKHMEKEMLVDIEWGAFGDNGVLDFIRTQWDDAVDQQSLLVHSYTFEKYYGGKYMGDLYREVLLTLARQGCLGRGGEGTLATHGSITTTTVSNIEKDSMEGAQAAARKMLEEAQLEWSEEDVEVARYVAGIVSYRGALLVSYVLVGILLRRMERPHCTVAIDGSLFRHHPRIRPLMEHLIEKFAPGHPFDLILAHDGSGKGAALVAAIADRLQNTTTTTTTTNTTTTA